MIEKSTPNSLCVAELTAVRSSIENMEKMLLNLKDEFVEFKRDTFKTLHIGPDDKGGFSGRLSELETDNKAMRRIIAGLPTPTHLKTYAFLGGGLFVFMAVAGACIAKLIESVIL
jgi:hypothetical protein